MGSNSLNGRREFPGRWEESCQDDSCAGGTENNQCRLRQEDGGLRWDVDRKNKREEFLTSSTMWKTVLRDICTKYRKFSSGSKKNS